jgi:hypothetical protein
MFSKRRIAKLRPGIVAVARAVSAGIIVSCSLVVVDQALAHFGLTGLPRLGDDLLGGVIVAVVAFLDDRRRRRYLARRLHVIALMNHHVRNSLQIIRFAQEIDHHVRLVNDAVERIEWALREVLPGEVIDLPSMPLAIVERKAEGSRAS